VKAGIMPCSRSYGRTAPRALILLGCSAPPPYGDGIITPADLGAERAEGIRVAAPAFKHFVLPVSCWSCSSCSLPALWDGRLGGVFGPIMLGWFAIIGALGAMEISRGRKFY